jgi:iron complex transport system substrate-binding protein
MARLFADAGADYFWKDDKHAGSLALSFESVFDKAQSADFWLFKYSAPTDITLRTLASEYSPYSRFIAFEKGLVFGCNLTSNRFFEEVPLHPDLLLKDFILIFHPDLFPGERCRYYHHLQP